MTGGRREAVHYHVTGSPTAMTRVDQLKPGDWLHTPRYQDNHLRVAEIVPSEEHGEPWLEIRFDFPIETHWTERPHRYVRRFCRWCQQHPVPDCQEQP